MPVRFAHNGVVYSVDCPGDTLDDLRAWSASGDRGFHRVTERMVVDDAGDRPVVPVGRWSDIDPCLVGVRGALVHYGWDCMRIWETRWRGMMARTVPAMYLPHPQTVYAVLEGSVEDVLTVPVDGFGAVMDVRPVPTVGAWGPPMTWRVEHVLGSAWLEDISGLGEGLRGIPSCDITVYRVGSQDMDGVGRPVARLHHEGQPPGRGAAEVRRGNARRLKDARGRRSKEKSSKRRSA